MGGRKSYHVERVVGKAVSIRPIKKALVDAIKSEDPKRIVSSAIKLFSGSKTAVSNLSKAAKLLDFIDENIEQKTLTYQERKELVTKEWAKIKKEQNLEAAPELDKIFIESATKVIRRGKK